MNPPIVLVASAGSSGSHLASVLLARREPFFTGPEANLASRPDLFDKTSFRLALLKGILQQEPYFDSVARKDGQAFHLVPPLVLTNPGSYGVETAAAKLDLLQKPRDWPGMIRYLHRQLVAAGKVGEKEVLVEHSPSCAVSLLAARAAIPRLKVAHIVRDPRDSIASMLARRRVAPRFASLSDDESLALTAQQWAFLTAAALRVADDAAYLRVSYEDMVNRPDDVTADLCRHFGFRNAKKRRRGPRLLGAVDQKNQWVASPTEAVTPQSVGRFKRDLTARQIKRLTAMRFRFPELDAEVRMKEMIERFGAA